MNTITIDFGPDQEPETIKKVSSIEFTNVGIFVFYQSLYDIAARFFDYNSYVTMTIH